MIIAPFDKTNSTYIEEAARLLADSFPQSYSQNSQQQIAKYIEDERIAIMAVDNGHLVGFVGAIPQYGNTGWELHPMMVSKSHQFMGIGTLLIKALEDAVAAHGGITIYLGTDDESDQTSLSQTDLYVDTYQKIEGAINLKKHPFEFYQKLGYKIVGVIPDANGMGKPDIFMAKRVVNL